MSGEIMIAVLDSEEAYVNRLTGYINSNGKNGIRLAGFTDSRKLNEYLKTNRISAVLCDREPSEYQQGINVPHLFVFGKDINKYQAADILMAEIKERVSADAGIKADTVSIFAVCCANPDYRLEALGKQIAEEKAAKGRTILLNLFPFSKKLQQSGKGSISDMLYQLKKKRSLSADLYFSGDGNLSCDVLEGVDYWGDISELTSEDVNLLFNELTEKFGYKNIVIIFDLLMPMFETVLEMSSSIYYPEPQSMFDNDYLEEMKRQLNFAGKQHMQDKIVICRGRESR